MGPNKAPTLVSPPNVDLLGMPIYCSVDLLEVEKTRMFEMFFYHSFPPSYDLSLASVCDSPIHPHWRQITSSADAMLPVDVALNCETNLCCVVSGGFYCVTRRLSTTNHAYRYYSREAQTNL